MNFLNLLTGVTLSFATPCSARVDVVRHQLHVDGAAQPFLYGAELQYFRLRGGLGPNIPAATVYSLWEKALLKMKAAKMNALSFYIPWDFHEIREGVFDFEGKSDEDGDGRADYPSRNVVHFIELAKKLGFKTMMFRPGPYINAEWGFLGFGAIPEWFHNKYPDSHMQNSKGQRTKLYDYHSPDLIRHTRLWFDAVYKNVMAPNMGDGGPMVFLQLDNETNFMWQSIFNHDYGPRALGRYRDFLIQEYGSLQEVNRGHSRTWRDLSQVYPPTQAGVNRAEDADWYRFQDHSIFTYLQRVRRMWEDIGVREPEVLFTLAESYNAMGNGLLPNFKFRSYPGKTGLMTVNLYPKTENLSGVKSILNLPFKTDLDVKSMVAANQFYFGETMEWLLGPEIQGGWWRGIEVTSKSRMQTYLTTIGHGIKGLFVYYFTEGQNWDHDWQHKKVLPIYKSLLAERGLGSASELSQEFWSELQARADQEVIVGLDVRRIVNTPVEQEAELYFDAPLDKNADPRPHFSILEDLGKKVIEPHSNFLAGAIEVNDDIGFLREVSCHAFSPDSGLNTLKLNADSAGGLLGLLLQDGLNPRILHDHVEQDVGRLTQMKVVLRQDCGRITKETAERVESYLRGGGWFVSFAGHALFDHLRGLPDLKCESRLERLEGGFIRVSRCTLGQGTFVFVDQDFYKGLNSDHYAHLGSLKPIRKFLKSLFPQDYRGFLRVVSGEKVAVFARRHPKKRGLWLTVKTGNLTAQSLEIELTGALLDAGQVSNARFVRDLLGESRYALKGGRGGKRFKIDLEPEDSRSLFIK